MAIRTQTLAFALVLIGLGAYAYVSLSGPSGYQALIEKRQLMHKLRARNEAMKAEIERRKARNRDLLENRDAQQQELRRQYDVLREGEKEFKYPEVPALPPAE
jgi:cell division protein FtsB